ncbi:MAG: selenium cofactor biosynthesis protein YqeC, partial [Pseudomonadota bacterium]
ALDLEAPVMAALVGAGGKTTLMFALASALATKGCQVITTTTTKIFHPRADQSPAVILGTELRLFTAALRTGLETHHHVTAAGQLLENNKIAGPPPEVIDDLFYSRVADFILVEADGAKGRPLKAPESYEPVIPKSAAVVIPVVGLAALGRPLDEESVFRPEIFSRLSGLPAGELITAGSIARVVFHPEGLCRGAPRRARLIPFLNQSDLVPASVARALAETIAEAGAGRASRVVWGSLKDPWAGFNFISYQP